MATTIEPETRTDPAAGRANLSASASASAAASEGPGPAQAAAPAGGAAPAAAEGARGARLIAPRGIPRGGLAQLRALAKGLVRHRATLYETGRALLASAGGVDPRHADPAALPRAALALTPDAEHARRFIEVTGGEVGWYERDGGLLLPPTYASTWGMRLVAELLAAARLDLPMARVLHVGNAVRFERWPRAGEPLAIEARVASIDAKPTRTIVVARLEHRTPAGDPLFVVDMTVFFPGRREGGGKGQRKGADKAAAGAAEVDRVPYGAREIGRLRPSLALTRAYTAVSGDFNPVHVSDLAAKATGFPRAFIHGYATKALLLHAVVGEVLGGDPTRLRAALVRFKKPLFTGVEAGVFVSEPERATPGVGGAAEASTVTRAISVGPGPGEAAHVSGTITIGEPSIG